MKPLTKQDPDRPLPLLIGGVLRCCIATFQQQAPAAKNTNEGDTINCAHCPSRLIMQSGYWGWDTEWDRTR